MLMGNTQTKQWDLDRVYPGDKVNSLKEQVSTIILHIDQVRTDLESQTHPQEILEMVKVIELVQTINTNVFEMDEYIICKFSVAVHDSELQTLNEQSTRMKSRMETLLLTFRHYLAAISDDQWHALLKSPEVQGIETFLTIQRQKVKDQLSPDLEKVIHALSVNGFDGWEDHYEQEFAQLTVPVSNELGIENIPFDSAFMRAMLSSDRKIREEIASSMTNVCRENEIRFASIFNHLAGYRNELYRLRGWSNPMKEMYEQNRISEDSVNSMIQALHQSKNLLHQFLDRKAQLNQLEKLSWYDIYSPTFTSKETVTYDQATEIVISQFYRFSEKMGKFAERAFEEGWIDGELSDSKRHGAFCASLPNSKESRVLLSFTGNYQDVVTLAHELGHAYHNFHLHEEQGFAHQTGTGLAETASTFAENLVLDAAIELADTEEDKLSLLELKIINGLKYIAYIPAKFEFEQQFYEKRKSQMLSATELTDLMEKSEREWFQDSLEEVNTHNWMTIPHFFNTEKAFFNLPYTIGYLFSNGVYSLYLLDKETLPERYSQLLSSSGNKTMEELGAEFLDQNLTEPFFWETSIKPLEKAISIYLEKTKAYL